MAGKLSKARQGSNGKLNADCPLCDCRGFTVSPPTQVPGLRHIWYCQHCRADANSLRRALARLGISDECLGTYGRDRRAAPDDLNAGMAARIEDIITDPKLRAVADLRIRLAELLWGEAPADYREFISFAMRAGVSRSKAYDTAARRGRRSATSRLPE